MPLRFATFGAINILLSLLMLTLGVAWAWDVLNAPASVAHPAWIARHELLMLSGLLSIGCMSLTMLLATRPTWLEGPLGGMDRVYRLHKWAGLLAGGFALLHWLVKESSGLLKSLIGRAGRLPKEDLSGILETLRHLGKDVGEWGFYLLLILLALTLWRRFPYRSWRFVHRAMPVIYLLLAFHAVALAPLDYWGQAVGWLMALLILAGGYGAVRALLGNIGRSRQSTAEIITVDRVGSDILQLRCRVRGGEQGKWSGHRPGQFVWLTFDAAEGAHPFSIASADQGDGMLEFQIKALGDYTRQLPSHLQPGQWVGIEGPYGRFEISRTNRQARQIWVAGGIGLTPFLAWLASLQKTPEQAPAAELHYCTRDRLNDPFVSRLEKLCAALPAIRLQVHGDQQGEQLNAARLLDEKSGTQRTEIWFCGPSGLADALRAGLPGRVSWHQEAFVMR